MKTEKPSTHEIISHLSVSEGVTFMNRISVTIFTIGIFLGSFFLIFISREKIGRNEKENRAEERTGALQALNFWTAARAYPETDIPANKYYKAYQTERFKRATLPTTMTLGSIWNPIGPTNLHGRAISVAINPNNSNTVYVGTASGGLWRSYTGGLGADWQQITLGYPALGISAIVIDPTDTNTIYIGTGEVYRDSSSDGGLVIRTTRGSYGIGILKSGDNGRIWTKSLDWTLNQQTGIQAIRINPLNHNTIWAATTEGVYRTNNAGTTWNNVRPVRMQEDILIYPADTNMVIASHGNFTINSGIDLSTDNGSSWIPVLYNGYTGKTVLDMYNAHPNVVYASASDSTIGYGEIWKSTDFGLNWDIVNSVTASLPSFGVQGWYSHYIAVHPADSSQIIHAEVNISKSVDGGKTFNYSAGSYSDHHSFAKVPSNPNLFYEVNDDGVYRSTDFGASFTGVGFGMQTGQFYNGFSSSTQDSLLLLGQSQDHIPGYIYRGGSVWANSASDEVGWTAIDPTNDNIMYVDNRNGSALFKSTDRGVSFVGVSGFTGSGGWNSPFAVSTSNPSVIYFADQHVYKSMTAGTLFTTMNGGSMLDGNPALSMAVAPTSSDTVYIGTSPIVSARHVFRTVNGGTSWNDITGSLPNRYPIDLAVDPFNSAVVYAAFGGFGTGHLFKSTNAGGTWSDITGTLPDVPTTAIAIDPLHSNNVYAGNDLGVYASTDGGSTWASFSEGLPDAVIAADLVISPANRTLRVATHGNGVYERKLIGAISPNFFDVRPITLNTPADGSVYIAGVPLPPILVSFRNASTIVTTDSINVKFRLLNGINEVFSSTKKIAPLGVAETRQVTFDGTFTPPDSGAFTIQAISLVSDSNSTDDTLRGALTIVLAPTVNNWKFTKSNCGYVEISGGTPGPFGDDATSEIPLPFPFFYDGYPYDSIQISTNGWLEFGTGSQGSLHGLSTPSQLTAYFVPSLGITSRPTKALGPWWADLSTGYNGTTGSVSYTTVGSSPNREFIVQWKYMLPYYDESATTMRINFQIHLFETTNIIEFHYGPVVPGAFPGYATGASMGLKDYVGGDYRYYDLAQHATGLSTQLRSNLTPVSDWPGQDSCIRIMTNFVGVSFTPDPGWNLMSMQVTPTDYSKQANFPSQNIFEYSAGYRPLSPTDSILPGAGFWARFDTIPVYRLEGSSLSTVTVTLNTGWNIIGGPDHDVAVPGGGAINSQFFGYSSSGYQVSTVLHAGKGYWVKSSKDTVLTFGPQQQSKVSSNPIVNFNSLVFQDKLGRSQTLYLIDDPDQSIDCEQYVMPPVPPAGNFDARFGSGRMAELLPTMTNSVDPVRYPIVMQSPTYPLIMKYKIKPGEADDIALEELSGNNTVAVYRLTGEGQLRLNDAVGRQLVLTLTPGSRQIPHEFAIRQNYPNPFNPTTRIEYDLPQETRVALRVYDIVGREIATIVDGVQNAGRKSVEFDASTLPSGIYLYKIDAGKFSEIKKMLLVK
jgi:photosystem II stability/assembly factor-like uncharacterized protein